MERRSRKHDRIVPRIEDYRANKEQLSRSVAQRALEGTVVKPGDTDPSGTSRLKDPVELGWELVDNVIPFPERIEPDDIVA